MKTLTRLLIFVLFVSCTGETPKEKHLTSEIALSTPTGNIYGSLTVSDTQVKSPLVIIIPGSGGNNRDGNMLPALHTNSYKMLAERLAEQGISTLRYDKRGVAKSNKAMESESKLRFETYVSDLKDWVSLLKKDNRFSTITLLGHSEGSLIGMLAASEVNVTSLISVAGVGKSADKLIREQLKTLPPHILSQANQAIDSLLKGRTVSNIDPSLNSIFRSEVQPYLISWMKYDPAIELAKLKIPVLIIQGTTDLQVSIEDAKILSEAKPGAQLAIIDNMNHILKEASDDVQQNISTYSNPNLPLKKELINHIISFIKK